MTTDQHSNQLPNEIHADEQPTKMKSSLSGTSDRILDVMQRGDKGVAIVEYECTGVGFKTLSKATAYYQDAKMLDFFPLPEAEGRERLKRARSEHRVGMAEASGQHPLPGTGDLGYTDASGVVLTAAEVAELQGRGETVVALSTTLVEYDREVADGECRDVWPDDYPKGASRPNVGDENERGVVLALLDHGTGLPLEVSGGGLAAGEAGESSDATATDDGDSPDSDPWDDPDPATSARLAAADVDPLVVDWLSQSTADIKLQVAGQMSRQFLDAALDAELNGVNKARPAVVAAIKNQIAGL